MQTVKSLFSDVLFTFQTIYARLIFFSEIIGLGLTLPVTGLQLFPVCMSTSTAVYSVAP